MATEYGKPKFEDSSKNLMFTMKGQPSDDELARVVNVVSKNNISISNLGFTSSSEYSKSHNSDVTYDIVVNTKNNTYRIDWKLKSNIGKHPNKTTSLKYGLLSWFNNGNEGTKGNPVTYTSTKHQMYGETNFNSSSSLAALRYFDAKVRVHGLDGDSNKEVVFNTASSFAGDNKQIKGVAQGFYNYDNPYTVFKAKAGYKDKNGNWIYPNWISFQTANGGISKEISITSSSGDISTDDNAHYLIVSDNSPSVKYGDISGTQTVHYNIDKDINGNSISNTHAGSVTFTSDNNGKAFTNTDTNKSNATSTDRHTTITYLLEDYNTSSSGLSNTISGSFTLYQKGGNIPPKDPELTYDWSIINGTEKYVSSTKVVKTNVTAITQDDKGNKYTQYYSYANKYIINVKDNSGTIGSITGTPSISAIFNPKPVYKTGTFTISGLTMTPAVNTSSRDITVRTKVSGNYCTNFNVSNTYVDTTVTQAGSNWLPKPTVVGKLSITCENPQTDKIDQSSPASFKIKQSVSGTYSTSLSNVLLNGNTSNEFYYEFGTISASSTNIKVSGDIKVTEPSNKTFTYKGGSINVTMYPGSLTFDAGYSKKVDDIKWKLKFTPDSTQNNKQYTNVKSTEITVTQTGIAEGSEKTYNPLIITGKSSSNWLTVGNTCTFNYNDYNNYISTKPAKMALSANPNRTSVNKITVTDTYASNVYKVKITDVDESVEQTASLALSSSDSNTTLNKTSITGFKQSTEAINCNVSLSYKDPNGASNKYVNLIGTGLSISDTNEHNLSIPRGTTGHTNNTLTGLSAVVDGDNDKLTIITSDGKVLWWSPNPDTSVYLNVNASGSNLGEYTLSKSSIAVSIPGDLKQTPWVKWYSKAEGGSWTKISDEASNPSISQSGSAASATSSSPSLTARGTGYGLTNKPFKLTRGQPSSASTKVYYKVESSAGSAGTDDSVYIERTDGSTGFGQVSVTASSTNISITADSSISVGSENLQVPGSTQYTDWYVYGPTVTLGTPSITTEAGLSKITTWKVGAKKSGVTIPETISAFAKPKDKEFKISVSVNPSVTARWEASISVGGLTSSDSGTFDTSSYGSGNIYSSITYKWDTGDEEVTKEITWKPDVHAAKEDYEESVSCTVTVTYQDGTKKSDTLTWKIKVLKTDVTFAGTLKCSDDKTINAFDPQTYDTSAWVDKYKVTATSGTLTEDWTKSYPPVLNTTEHKLTAVQGTDATTTGSTSFKYTFKTPEISNANAKNTLEDEHTVYLYCYGVTVDFAGTLKCSDDKTITAFDPQTYDTSAFVDKYKVTATSGLPTVDENGTVTKPAPTEDWTKTYTYTLNDTTHKLTAVPGANATTLGSSTYEYTFACPVSSIPNTIAIGNNASSKHTVKLYTYGVSLDFTGTLKCSDDKTITAFDPQIYVTTSSCPDYTITARSGINSDNEYLNGINGNNVTTQNWTNIKVNGVSTAKSYSDTYPPVFNATTYKLTAVPGANATTLGSSTYEYTVTSTYPSVESKLVVNTKLQDKKEVTLYTYGVSLDFAGTLNVNAPKTITAFDPQIYVTTSSCPDYTITARSGINSDNEYLNGINGNNVTTQNLTNIKVNGVSTAKSYSDTYPPVFNATTYTLNAVLGTDAFTTGKTTYEYTVKSTDPSVESKLVVNTKLQDKKEVILYCYGKSYYNK